MDGKPAYDYFFFVKAKLNGVYDINGGLSGETFNVGQIPVWEGSDQQRIWMDMHQSQVRFRGQSQTEMGTYTAYMEGDYWGGSKHFRLRHMWFELQFAQLASGWSFVGHIGQDWSFFGDKEIWPNVFDWDGPSSGVWRREPELRLWFENQDRLRLEFGIAQPGPELYFSPAVDSTLSSAEQPLPDFIGAINKGFEFGHLRLTGIYRNMRYASASDYRSVAGYGGTLSGYVRTCAERENPVQFQLVAGKGIATYLVSFSGMDYDALGDGQGNLLAVPTYGGWISYEHWFSRSWHANLVLGLSHFKSDPIGAFTIAAPGYPATNTSVETSMQYGLLNLMWDPIPSVVIGLEWNIGNRTNVYEGTIVTEHGAQSRVERSRVANRISFGAFFNF